MIKVLLGILGLVLALILIAIIRTILFIKPKTSTFESSHDEIREQKYATILSKMVQYETISVKGENQREKFLGFHKILEEQFPLVHKHMEKTEIDGNLLFKWTGKQSDKPIVLMSHQDVVSADGNWERDPFSGEISQGKVWGRGACDTKCSVMAFFQACEELLEQGYTPQQDIYLSSSCTEEVGGDGCPKLVNELKRRGVKPWLVVDEGGAIVNEPIGGCKGNFAMIGVVEKGQGNLEFTAHSNGGHSSYPSKNTPIARLSKFVVDIEKHDPFKKEFIPQAKAMFETLAPYCPFYMRLLFGNLWLFKPLLKLLMPSISAQGTALIKTTMAFTMQSGSSGYNVLPQEAKLIANLRYAPHQGMNESNKVVEDIAQKYDLEMRIVDGYDYCPPVDIHSDAFHYVEQVVHDVFKDLPTCPYVMTGGTDARFYEEISENCIRFAPIVFGKEQMKGMHGLNECVETSSLPGAVDFYKGIITKC